MIAISLIFISNIRLLFQQFSTFLVFFVALLHLNIISPWACTKILLLLLYSLVLVSLPYIVYNVPYLMVGTIFISTIVKSFLFFIFLLSEASNIKLYMRNWQTIYQWYAHCTVCSQKIVPKLIVFLHRNFKSIQYLRKQEVLS